MLSLCFSCEEVDKGADAVLEYFLSAALAPSICEAAGFDVFVAAVIASELVRPVVVCAVIAARVQFRASSHSCWRLTILHSIDKGNASFVAALFAASFPSVREGLPPVRSGCLLFGDFFSSRGFVDALWAKEDIELWSFSTSDSTPAT